MSKKEKKELSEQLQDAVEKGNTRKVVIRTQDGRKVAEFSLTVAVIIGVGLLFFPGSWPFLLLSAVAAVVMRIRIEVIRELSEDDTLVEIKRKPQEEDEE